MEKIKFSQTIIILLVFILGIVIGAMVGSVLIKEKAYQQGLTEGKRQIEEKYQRKIAEIFPSLEEEEVFSVQGKITEIKDKSLSLETTSYPANPFGEPKTEVRLVKIIDSTEIVKRVMKSSEELLREDQTYTEALESLKETEELPTAPLPYKDIAIEFSEFKIGSEIEVEAEENIKDKDEFFAKKLILQFTFNE